jgi:hypothetical protein
VSEVSLAFLAGVVVGTVLQVLDGWATRWLRHHLAKSKEQQ